MKKVLALIVGACLTVAGANRALAEDVEMKVSGKMNFGYGFYDNMDWNSSKGDEKFSARQKMSNRVQLIANENLKGVVQFNVTTIDWGHGGGDTWGGSYPAGSGAGGAMGAGGVNISTKFMYLDWVIPEADITTRMGMQWFGLPQAVWRGDGEGGGSIFDDNAMGIVLSKDLTEEVGVSLAWFRPWDAFTESHESEKFQSDEIDSFILSVPIEVKDVMSIKPYTMFAMIGDVDTRINEYGQHENYGAIAPWLSATGTLGKNGQAWWLGTAFTLEYFDPFKAYIDLMYGSYSADTVAQGDSYLTNTMNPDRDGWAVQAKFDYNLEHFTPSIWGWYASGSKGLDEHGMDGMMPSYTPYFGLTSYGFSRSNGVGKEFIVGSDPYGKWGIGASLDKIKYFDDLTSHLRVLYFGGTNNSNDNPEAFTTYGLFGWQDRGIEVNFDNVVGLYENLDMLVELAYINLDLDKKPETFNPDSYKAFVEFIYYF